MEACALNKTKHSKSWLVQLTIGIQRKVSKVVEKCPLEMDLLFTWKNLNALLVGYCDVLIGMD